MAASERLRGACARYAQLERRVFGASAREWFRGRRGPGWEERLVKRGFTTFWLATQEDWTLLAADLLRRWRLPEHRGGVEDLRQELAIGAYKALRRYAGGHGTELHEYVVWNALAFAKKKLHKLRGAKLSGNSGKNPSRIERPFSAMGEEGTEGDGAVECAMLSAGMVAEPDHEERIEVRERREEVTRDCESRAEEIVVEVTFEGAGLDEGARRLYEDPDACLAYRLGCEEGARRVVGLAAHSLAARVEWLDEECA